MEQLGLRRGEREEGEWFAGNLQRAFGDDVDLELGERLITFLRAQNELARAIGALADAPVFQDVAGDFLNLALAGNVEREFLGLAVEDVEGDGELIGDFVAGDLDGLMDGSREDDLGLGRRFRPVRAFDDDPQLAIGEVALDGRVLDFGIGVGGESRHAASAVRRNARVRDFISDLVLRGEKLSARRGWLAGRIFKDKV